MAAISIVIMPAADLLTRLLSGKQSVLIQIYHGEFHYFYPKGMPAYGGSGLALSYDGGNTFKKIGQILYPHLSRSEYLTTNPVGGLWSDAAMIEADGDGHYPDKDGKGSHEQEDIRHRENTYEYLVFMDHDSAREVGNVVGIARARKADVLDALKSNKAPVFYKYFNPKGALVFDGKYFTEPGIGGNLTSVAGQQNQAINSPGIVYDVYIHQYILSYQYNQRFIVLQTSDDLLHWSAPTVVSELPLQGVARLFNPSIAGTGPDPDQPGQQFYLYYLERDVSPGHGLINPRLRRVLIRID
jgi:hypothetical protein